MWPVWMQAAPEGGERGLPAASCGVLGAWHRGRPVGQPGVVGLVSQRTAALAGKAAWWDCDTSAGTSAGPFGCKCCYGNSSCVSHSVRVAVE